MKLKVDSPEVQELAMLLAKEHGNLAWNDIWHVAHTVIELGYRRPDRHLRPNDE